MKRKPKIEKLSLRDFFRSMTNNLKDNQISLYGFRVNLIRKMMYEWGIEDYKDLTVFPFSKLLMYPRSDIEFLGRLELQMSLHGMHLNMDTANIPTFAEGRRGSCWSHKLDQFYEWMEEHENLIHWSDLPNSNEKSKAGNIQYYESEEDYLRDIFRGLVEQK